MKVKFRTLSNVNVASLHVKQQHCLETADPGTQTDSNCHHLGALYKSFLLQQNDLKNEDRFFFLLIFFLAQDKTVESEHYGLFQFCCFFIVML